MKFSSSIITLGLIATGFAAPQVASNSVTARQITEEGIEELCLSEAPNYVPDLAEACRELGHIERRQTSITREEAFEKLKAACKEDLIRKVVPAIDSTCKKFNL